MTIRFLVVDDATFIRDTMKKQLRDRIPGCEVYDAIDGNKAIVQLRKQHVDVILSDWEMPGMSGEEFLRWVRAEEDIADTPFIMVTSRGDKDHVVKAIKSGVSDFITKPFTSDELLKKVSKQLLKIGKTKADLYAPPKAGKGTAFASIDVLTGGSQTPVVTNKISQTAASSVSALTSGAVTAAPKPSTKPAAAPRAKAKTKAQLRFPNLTCGCVVRDITLKSFSGLIQRPDSLPGLFDQAVVDIELDDGTLARLNGYLSSLSAGEHKQDAQIVKVIVSFVDNDPEKFEALSRFIAKHR